MLSLIDEFKKDSQDDRVLSYGFLWLGRLLFLIPIISIAIGYFVRIDTANIYDLIEKQYGIKFDQNGGHNKVSIAPVEAIKK